MATRITKIKYSWSFDDVSYSGFEESTNFSAPGSPTQFYLRLTKEGKLSLHLASCSQQKLHITKFVVEAFHYGGERVTKSLSGKISLDRSCTLDCSLFDGDDNDDAEMTWEVECVIRYKEPLVKTDHKHQLADNLVALRLDSNLADVTLVTIDDGQEFPAHKLILSMRSPVFAAMFKHEGVVENVENRVEIEGVTGKAMEVFLNYIYSGNVSKVGKFAAELFELANKYDIQPLIQACAETITVANVAQLYYLADLHQQEDFKKKTMLFISENKRAVKRSNGWNEFIKPSVALLDQLIDFLWIPVGSSSKNSSK